jgi:hypothetical protein
VDSVTWTDAVAFCQKATEMLRQRKLVADGEVIRLPSEAEWEYVCRAGTTTAYSFGDKGDDLKDYSWFKGNSKGEDPAVGKKKPNPWGLYDVHGYGWEWCLDDWAPTTRGLRRTAGGASTLPRRRCFAAALGATRAETHRSAYRHTAAGNEERHDRLPLRPHVQVSRNGERGERKMEKAVKVHRYLVPHRITAALLLVLLFLLFPHSVPGRRLAAVPGPRRDGTSTETGLVGSWTRRARRCSGSTTPVPWFPAGPVVAASTSSSSTARAARR